MKRRKKVLIDTFEKSIVAILAVLMSFVGSALVFYLYDLPLEPFIYAAVLISFFGIMIFIFTYAKELNKAKSRELMINTALTELNMPPAYSLAEEDYGEVISLLQDEVKKLRNEYENARQDEIDYYTTWVHQIKTPISVIRMEIGGNDTENCRIIETEIFRIEQYVDMVLQYIRLGDGSNDLVIREYSLDSMIRETIRKFAPQFLQKKLALCYDGTSVMVVSDKKWFCCILEQIISNAIKYTQTGSITISVENDILNIRDTGIGISPEDVPLIFEKGYTGVNGRFDKKSSGLGLYLCKKAADLIQIPLAVESEVGKGTRFSLDLKGKIKG